jgi:pimeloyl-ACP methyl ester carboxylesterase
MQVLFIQGGGAGTHDDWDDRLRLSLQQHLGPAHEVRYPRMPGEDDPSFPTWSPAIRQELAELDDGAVAVGHSVGGTLLLQTLAVHLFRSLRSVAVLGAPFDGLDAFPEELPVHVFHGLADEYFPPEHAERYARAIPQARLHLLPGRNHQLNDDLSEVARAIS